MGATTVLIVDDDPGVVQTTKAMLEHGGLNVLTAVSGEQALRILSTKPQGIDLVLSDVRMSGMNGPELIKKVKQMSPSTGVMLMSGYTEMSKQDPDVPFISKPFRLITVLAAIQEIGRGAGEEENESGALPRWKSVATRLAGVSPEPSDSPLAYLPGADVVKYTNGQTIYGPEQPPDSLYFILDGRVNISRIAENGGQVLVDIYPADEIFGDAAFLGAPQPSEQATALGTTRLLSWSTAEVEQAIRQRPQLAVEILHVMAQHMVNFGRRIESLSLDSMERRLARALVHFAERLGTPDIHGSVHIISFPHELLSKYVGTSREVITKFMNQFRRQGYIEYSRDGITVHPVAFRDWSASEPPAS